MKESDLPRQLCLRAHVLETVTASLNTVPAPEGKQEQALEMFSSQGQVQGLHKFTVMSSLKIIA